MNAGATAKPGNAAACDCRCATSFRWRMRRRQLQGLDNSPQKLRTDLGEPLDRFQSACKYFVTASAA
jgi:hypothetical protein